MRNIFCLISFIFTATFISCQNKENLKPDLPKDNIVNYKLSEPKEYISGGMSSFYSILLKDNVAIDTVDFSFGVHSIGNDSIIVWPVRHFIQTEDGLEANPAKYLLITNSARITLSDMLPDFDNYYSSPNVIDSTLYYWGIKNINDSGYLRLTAIKYIFRQQKLDSLFLENYFNEGTDDWSNFYQPILENDNVVYEHQQIKWILNKNNFMLVNAVNKK